LKLCCGSFRDLDLPGKARLNSCSPFQWGIHVGETGPMLDTVPCWTGRLKIVKINIKFYFFTSILSLR
jgi:hypothetical protein